MRKWIMAEANLDGGENSLKYPWLEKNKIEYLKISIKKHIKFMMFEY